MDATLYELSSKLGALLKARALTLATAESCTGGWISQAVTMVSGSSAWFDRGFVTYTNDAKQEALGVSAETLQSRGAVSEETVKEMARGALERSHADISVAVSGIAGPEGGTPDKPVGTVCIAWASRDTPPSARRFHFSGDRDAVRRQSVIVALEGLIDHAGQQGGQRRR